ncbi:unnamed protein product [Haemonchus placei]|uniref:Uncharacterized protein n=1 Tax=Haemonchus placei TaxID=6290 RepID=A0A3P7YQ15_HAEPC|nr:unnamed protein product [Haemonchus placei]
MSGDAMNYSIYRVIELTSHTMKIRFTKPSPSCVCFSSSFAF